jgi:hypothetical protein
MDELTLWEIIESFCNHGNLVFCLRKINGGWVAHFGDNFSAVFPTRKEALIHAITKLKLEA